MRLIKPAKSNPTAIRRESMDGISGWNYNKTFAILSVSSRLAWLGGPGSGTLIRESDARKLED
jgi:hypothetical protein